MEYFQIEMSKKQSKWWLKVLGPCVLNCTKVMSFKDSPFPSLLISVISKSPSSSPKFQHDLRLETSLVCLLVFSSRRKGRLGDLQELFGFKPSSETLHKLTAFAYKDYLSFGYVYVGLRGAEEMTRQYNVNVYTPTILIFKENIHRPADVIQVRGCRLVSTWPSRFLSRCHTQINSKVEQSRGGEETSFNLSL